MAKDLELNSEGEEVENEGDSCLEEVIGAFKDYLMSPSGTELNVTDAQLHTQRVKTILQELQPAKKFAYRDIKMLAHLGAKGGTVELLQKNR